jgi:hypothetical protein
VQEPINPVDVNQIGSLSLKELAAVLIKHYKLHEGLYETSIGLQVAVGAVGPTPDTVVPGAMLGVTGVGLRKTDVVGLHTIDASEVNPKKKSKNT